VFYYAEKGIVIAVNMRQTPSNLLNKDGRDKLAVLVKGEQGGKKGNRGVKGEGEKKKKYGRDRNKGCKFFFFSETKYPKKPLRLKIREELNHLSILLGRGEARLIERIWKSGSGVFGGGWGKPLTATKQEKISSITNERLAGKEFKKDKGRMGKDKGKEGAVRKQRRRYRTVTLALTGGKHKEDS